MSRIALDLPALASLSASLFVASCDGCVSTVPDPSLKTEVVVSFDSIGGPGLPGPAVVTADGAVFLSILSDGPLPGDEDEDEPAPTLAQDRCTTLVLATPGHEVERSIFVDETIRDGFELTGVQSERLRSCVAAPFVDASIRVTARGPSSGHAVITAAVFDAEGDVWSRDLQVPVNSGLSSFPPDLVPRVATVDERVFLSAFGARAGADEPAIEVVNGGQVPADPAWPASSARGPAVVELDREGVIQRARIVAAGWLGGRYLPALSTSPTAHAFVGAGRNPCEGSMLDLGFLLPPPLEKVVLVTDRSLEPIWSASLILDDWSEVQGVLDNEGAIFLVGTGLGDTALPGGAIEGSVDVADTTVAKVDASGTPLWEATWAAVNEDGDPWAFRPCAVCLFVTEGDQLVVWGELHATVQIADVQVEPSANANVLMVVVEGDGEVTRVERVPFATDDASLNKVVLSSVAMDEEGTVWFAGAHEVETTVAGRVLPATSDRRSVFLARVGPIDYR